MKFSIQIFVEDIIVSEIELQFMRFHMVSFENKDRALRRYGGGRTSW